MTLRDGQGAGRAALVEPVAPSAAGRGLLDTQEQAAFPGGRHGRTGQNGQHGTGLPTNQLRYCPKLNAKAPYRRNRNTIRSLEWPAWKT
jgi:hypothetical protein